MAGDWIKWSKGFAKKPEVLKMAGILKISRQDTATRLMEVYEWADENIALKDFDEEGNAYADLGDLGYQFIDETAGLQGFADAMAIAGWLNTRQNRLVFPNFDRHNGKTAKERALDQKRKQANPVSDRKSVRKNSGSNPEKNRTREEKSIEEASASSTGTHRRTKRDDIFDATVRVFGLKTGSKTLNRRVGDLVNSFVPLVGSLPAEKAIRRVVELHRQKWPHIDPVTPDSVIKHWSDLTHRAKGGQTREERRAQELRAEREREAKRAHELSERATGDDRAEGLRKMREAIRGPQGGEPNERKGDAA